MTGNYQYQLAEESSSSTGLAVMVSADIYGEKVSVDGTASSTLLSAFKAHGVDAPYACEEGQCGSCICRLVEGRVTMRRNEVLSPEELTDGYILACQAVPDRCDVSVIFD